MWKIIIILGLVINIKTLLLINCVLATTETNSLTSKNFQINFINEIASVVEKASQEHLNHFLKELRGNSKYDMYSKEFQEAIDSAKVPQKIVFAKQLLDVKNVENENILDYYTLRNVNFLKKIEKKLEEWQEESAHELRQLRIYNLCRQFRAKETPEIQSTSIGAKLVPLNGRNIDSALQKLNTSTLNYSIDIQKFGRNLYENVKITGAEIIDDYLNTLRKLLREVIEGKTDYEQNTPKLTKLLMEINAILEIDDFYEKRQRLYFYLQNNLAVDYEQFKSSQDAEEDLVEIFTKLKSKSLDLFVTFLFSNFEFLEHLHEQWTILLSPQVTDTTSLSNYDELSKLLHDTRRLYDEFKKDSESNPKYEQYLSHTNMLYTKTVNMGPDVHVFDLLHNASQNVGPVTMNMIKTKCEEI